MSDIYPTKDLLDSEYFKLPQLSTDRFGVSSRFGDTSRLPTSRFGPKTKEARTLEQKIEDEELYLYALGEIGIPPGTGVSDIASALLIHTPDLTDGNYEVDVIYISSLAPSVVSKNYLVINGDYFEFYYSADKKRAIFEFIVENGQFDLKFTSISGDDMGMLLPAELYVFDIVLFKML